MECFSKGFLKQLRKAQLNVDLDQDSIFFGACQTLGDLFRLLYSIWQQGHSLKSLEVNLPILPNLGIIGITQEHLEEYVGLVVVSLILLKKEIDNNQISITASHCEPSQPPKQPIITNKDVREALPNITLDYDILKPGKQFEVTRGIVNIANYNERRSLENFIARYPGWNAWWNCDKSLRRIKNTFWVLDHKRIQGNRAQEPYKSRGYGLKIKHIISTLIYVFKQAYTYIIKKLRDKIMFYGVRESTVGGALE